MGEIRAPLTPITDEDLPDNVAGADSLKVGAVTADKITANAITSDKIAAGAITADKITLTIDDIPDGSQYGRIKKVSLTADGLVILDEVLDGSNYGKIKKSSLTADGLVVLDAVQDGDTYAKVLKTNISAGSILLSKVIEDDQHKTVNSTQKLAIDPTTGQLKTAVTPATYLGSPSSSGLFLGADYLGYYDGSHWKTYMANNGSFYLNGSAGHYLSWNGAYLTISGNIIIQNPSEVRTKINVEDGADVTLNHTAKEIVNLKSVPAGSGFYVDGSSLGFYDGNYWRTYINNSGYLVMRNNNNQLVLRSGYFTESAIAAQNTAEEQFNVYDGQGHCTFHASGQEVSVYPNSSNGTFLFMYGKPSNEQYQAMTGLSMQIKSLIGGNRWALTFYSIGDNSYAFGSYIFDHPVYRDIGSGAYLPFIVSGSAVAAELIQHGQGTITDGNSSITIYFSVEYDVAPDVIVTGSGSGETNNFHVTDIYTNRFTVGIPTSSGDHQFKWVAIGTKN